MLNIFVFKQKSTCFKFQEMCEIDSKPVIGHYAAGDELDIEDLYTKYKVGILKVCDKSYSTGQKFENTSFFNLFLKCLNFYNVELIIFIP